MDELNEIESVNRFDKLFASAKPEDMFRSSDQGFQAAMNWEGSTIENSRIRAVFIWACLSKDSEEDDWIILEGISKPYFKAKVL